MIGGTLSVSLELGSLREKMVKRNTGGKTQREQRKASRRPHEGLRGFNQRPSPLQTYPHTRTHPLSHTEPYTHHAFTTHDIYTSHVHT